MKIIGVICEYNPFHTGHIKQLRMIRERYGNDCGIVCLMSGNFVQRGKPAIFDKSLRAQAALLCGADLVLELPVTTSLSSAEGFAAGGVRILSGFCHGLCFGTETGTAETLTATAKSMLSPVFSETLKKHLQTGVSFPAARVLALKDLGGDASLLSCPNDILAVEYCKAILSQDSSMLPIPIHREGGYHDTLPDPENPSATAVRLLLQNEQEWSSCVPKALHKLYSQGSIYSLQAGERAVLARLRTMTDSDFEALPFGSEGLWRRLMHASREHSTLEDILTATKSKRYTRSRLDRMVMCAFLGITKAQMNVPAPYTRVLGFNGKGTAILKLARQNGSFPHIGEEAEGTFTALEARCDDLYGLFRKGTPAPAGIYEKRRVFILP